MILSSQQELHFLRFGPPLSQNMPSNLAMSVHASCLLIARLQEEKQHALRASSIPESQESPSSSDGS